MDTKILCTGKVVGGEIQWRIPAIPVVKDCAPDGTIQAMVDAAHQDIFFYECDAEFDAPEPFSFFDHLLGSGHPPTSHELWWRGYHAQRAGRALASMPTEAQEQGWWASYFKNGKYDGDGCIEDDHFDICTGSSGMGLF